MLYICLTNYACIYVCVYVCWSTPLNSLTQMRKSQCLNYKSGGLDQDRVLFQQVKGDKVTERIRNNINSFWSTLGNGSPFKTETVTTNSILTDLDVVLLLYLQNIMKATLSSLNFSLLCFIVCFTVTHGKTTSRKSLNWAKMKQWKAQWGEKKHSACPRHQAASSMLLKVMALIPLVTCGQQRLFTEITADVSSPCRRVTHTWWLKTSKLLKPVPLQRGSHFLINQAR